MPALLANLVVLSSTVLRICSYLFLRWIPGHHFPPLVLCSFLVYIVSAAAFSDFSALDKHSKENGRPPGAVNAHEKAQDGESEDVSLIGQSDKPAHSAAEEEDTAAFWVLLSGLPNWKLTTWSWVTIGINILLVLFTLDLVFRGPALYPSKDLRFSRVGFVDSHSAKILFREPDSAQLPVFVYHKQDGQDSWTTAERVYSIDAETDYTCPVHFEHLRPSTLYTYSLSNNLTGSFTTAPSPGTPAAGRVTFLTSSCIKANFPYNPLSRALSIPGFTHLSDLVSSLPTPAAFMLFLGDFIYVDVPRRLSTSTWHYRAEHRRVYASPSWTLPNLSNLPWLHTLDDHEIANDWSAGNSTAPFPAAQDPFLHYHVSVNPPTPPSAPTGPNTTYFTFTRGPASFFLLDTCAYRTDPEPNPNATILGAEQLTSLLSYLSTPEPPTVHWKIIASSVPFTKNWRFGTSDTWGGFLRERSLVLSAMHRAESHLGVRVIILSGDRHEFAAIRFPPPPLPPPPPDSTTSPIITTPQSGPHEFSVGPLSMFYLPFRTFRQTSSPSPSSDEQQDVAIKYIPDGNSKVGVVDLENLAGTGQQRSLLRYRLVVDGEVEWEYSLTSPGPEFEGWRGGRRGNVGEGVLDALWG